MLQYNEPTTFLGTSAIGWGESLRGFNAQMRYINVLKFVAQKDGAVTLHLAEYGSPATTYQFKLSQSAGDLSGASEGNYPQSSINVAVGQTYYANFRAWSRDIGPTATHEVQGVVVEGSWP